MKQVCLVMVMVLAIAALAGSRVGSAENTLSRQDQSAKQKDKAKDKDEPKDKDKAKDKDEPKEKISGALGTKTNPVRCEAPRGERQYLSRLRCPDGNRPEYSRIGSFGEGPYGNILDGYRVKCEGIDEATVFMDMYHRGYIEKEAVPGFTIVD